MCVAQTYPDSLRADRPAVCPRDVRPAEKIATRGDEHKKGIESGMLSFFNTLNFVGVTGLEPATSRPPDAYSNQLSYTPIVFGG